MVGEEKNSGGEVHGLNVMGASVESQKYIHAHRSVEFVSEGEKTSRSNSLKQLCFMILKTVLRGNGVKR